MNPERGEPPTESAGTPASAEQSSRQQISAQQIAIAVVTQGGRVLIGQRPPGVALAGFWEFPGGKVHPGESPAQAAVRECLEETGLAIAPLESLGAVQHTYAHGRLVLWFFHCRVVPTAAEPVGPRPPFIWVPIGELPRYPFPAANETMLARLARLA